MLVILAGYAQSSGKTTSSQSVGNDGKPCPGAASVTDIDGNTYKTVQIGKQCWMKENLRTNRYANGTLIPVGSTTSTTTAYRYAPDGNNSYVFKYGYLYNWPAVMHGARSSKSNPSGVQGICPKGWHVPSDAEWSELTNYVKSKSEYVCGEERFFYNIVKALASTEGWKSDDKKCTVGNNPSANNATGFSALPAGYFFSNYIFYVYESLGYDANFWSATEFTDDRAYYRFLNYDTPMQAGLNTARSTGIRSVAFAIRADLISKSINPKI